MITGVRDIPRTKGITCPKCGRDRHVRYLAETRDVTHFFKGTEWAKEPLLGVLPLPVLGTRCPCGYIHPELCLDSMKGLKLITLYDDGTASIE